MVVVPPARSPLSAAALVAAARRALRSPQDAAAELERFLTDRYAARDIVLVHSGTQALTLAIQTARTLHACPDAPVALPAYSCFDLATAAIGARTGVVLYDVDPDTLGPDWESFERAFESGARTAVVAPLYGLPVDWERASAVAACHGATLVEDAAQAAGARWDGRPVGSLGPLSVLSFGRGKGWTGGGGGALLSRLDVTPLSSPTKRTPIMRELRTVTGAGAQWLLSDPRLYALPSAMPWLHLGETRYHPPTSPAPMPAFSAALALAVADQLDDELACRQRAAERFIRALSDVPGVRLPAIDPHARPGYLRFPVLVTDDVRRADLLTRGARAGVAPGYPMPLYQLQPLRPFLADRTPLPGAAALCRQLVTMPTHSRSNGDVGELFAASAPS